MCMKNGVPAKPKKGACNETHQRRNTGRNSYTNTFYSSTATWWDTTTNGTSSATSTAYVWR